MFQEALRLGYRKAGHQLADKMRQDGMTWSDPVGALACCLWPLDLAQSGDEMLLDRGEVGAALSADDRATARLRAKDL